MIDNDEYKRLLEDHEVAYIKGDLATSMPESYTVDEMPLLHSIRRKSRVRPSPPWKTNRSGQLPTCSACGLRLPDLRFA